MRFKNIEFSEEKLIEFLTHLGFTNVTNNKDYINFSWYDGANPKGSCIYKDSLIFKYWSKNKSGDLIDLISHKMSCETRQSFKILQRFFKTKIVSKDYSQEDGIESVVSLINNIKNTYSTYPIYPDSILNKYDDCISSLFLADGVGYLSQCFWDIKYDEESGRICFPVRDIDGNVVGVLGRWNEKEVSKGIAKYLPVLRYDKHNFLFGAYENKDFLHDKIYIVESEKSVMRAFSLGYRNVLAIGGNYISPKHIDILYRLTPSEVILALDEGILDNYIIEQAKSLKSTNPFVSWHVGYLKSNQCGLPHKYCVFDLPKDECEKILKNNIEFII